MNMPLKPSAAQLIAPDTTGQNFYRNDQALADLLRIHLPDTLFNHIEPHLDRLGEARAIGVHVAAGEQSDEQAIHERLLSHERASDFVAHTHQRFTRALEAARGLRVDGHAFLPGNGELGADRIGRDRRGSIAKEREGSSAARTRPPPRGRLRDVLVQFHRAGACSGEPIREHGARVAHLERRLERLELVELVQPAHDAEQHLGLTRRVAGEPGLHHAFVHAKPRERPDVPGSAVARGGRLEGRGRTGRVARRGEQERPAVQRTPRDDARREA